MKAQQKSRGSWFFPLILIIIGIVLLLNNFLLLGDFDATRLLPLILVAVGAMVLLRGDILPTSQSRSFGITRGSVESGTLEVQAGAIDVNLRRLQREGRLIAGQFAENSRPVLDSIDTHANIFMHRRQTPWTAFNDWLVALAHDLPWQIYISSSMGQINADCSGLILQSAVIASGISDIQFTCPQETLEEIHLQSALGNIHVLTDIGQHVIVHVKKTRLFDVQVDFQRFEEVEPNVYATRDADLGAPITHITVQGTFGNAYLV